MIENKNEKQIDIPKEALLYKSEVDESIAKGDQETAENAPYEVVEGYEVAKIDSTSKQVGQTRDEKGRITGGVPPVGFHTNPENRSNGRWKKEDSISYNYNLFLAMSEEDFAEYKPLTKAQKIAYQRILAAESSLNDAKEITDRTEGKAPQAIDMTSNGETINPMSGLTIEELRKLAGK